MQGLKLPKSHKVILENEEFDEFELDPDENSAFEVDFSRLPICLTIGKVLHCCFTY
jgi:hypothetical protein